MTDGYVYVLQNKSYGPYVVKIGLSTRSPDLRAREIYAGATGVPEPFDIAAAYSVADCRRAEALAHKRLAPYRINRRREFFRISPSVASTVAYDSCCKINKELSLPPPEALFLSRKPNDTSTDTVAAADAGAAALKQTITVYIEKLLPLPAGTSSLSPEQLDRAEILSRIFESVYPNAAQVWQENFSCDLHPERELRVWENMAKAFLSVDEVEFLSEDAKREAFALLLSRSTLPTDEVLMNTKLRHFDKKAAKLLLRAYKLKPKPIVLSTNRSAS